MTAQYGLTPGKSLYFCRDLVKYTGNEAKEDSPMSDQERKPFYITTAIAYTSSKPHIGNTYDAVLADAIARYKRLRGYDVYFQTGSDEHGQKIQLAAEKEGISPKAYVDRISDQIKAVWDSLDLSLIHI